MTHLSINGPDFVRAQWGAGTGRQPDPLHPDVVFSGNYDDGTCMFFQQYYSANTQGTIYFGKTCAFTPIVFGVIKLGTGLTQGSTTFNSGEYLMAQHYRQQNLSQNPTHDRSFAYEVTRTQINLEVRGFSGVVTFLVLDN